MTVVMANGCFDPWHYGHLLHLQAARAMGDKLVVALTSDATVRLEKGIGRPLFWQQERAAVLMALRGIVDQVVIVDSLMEGFHVVQPQIFVKGTDYSIWTIADDVIDYCRRMKIAVQFTATPKWSATAIGEAIRGTQSSVLSPQS